VRLFLCLTLSYTIKNNPFQSLVSPYKYYNTAIVKTFEPRKKIKKYSQMNSTVKTLGIMAVVALAVVLVLQYVQKEEVVVTPITDASGKQTGSTYTVKRHWFKIK
jgi:hypothetical protein